MPPRVTPISALQQQKQTPVRCSRTGVHFKRQRVLTSGGDANDDGGDGDANVGDASELARASDARLRSHRPQQAARAIRVREADQSSAIGERASVLRWHLPRQEHRHQRQGRRRTSESYDVPYSNFLFVSEVATPQLFRTIDERNVNRFGSTQRYDACPLLRQRLLIRHSRHDDCFHANKNSHVTAHRSRHFFFI
jgi:hypothetical protein